MADEPIKLPPDPEGLNDSRAARAEKALEAYREDHPADEQDLSDLLCDLRHWADRHCADFDVDNARAADNYAIETVP